MLRRLHTSRWSAANATKSALPLNESRVHPRGFALTLALRS